MSLAALMLAAAVGGAEPSASETPNLYRPQGRCSAVAQQVIERQRETLRKLGQLPRAGAQYAVLRQVDGCAIPTPMGYHPDYLLPGAADPVSQPLTREDGPSNRR